MAKLTAKIVDESGRVIGYAARGRRFIPLSEAVVMAESDELPGVHAVRPFGAPAYIRSDPDASEKNNLAELSKRRRC